MCNVYSNGLNWLPSWSSISRGSSPSPTILLVCSLLAWASVCVCVWCVAWWGHYAFVCQTTCLTDIRGLGPVFGVDSVAKSLDSDSEILVDRLAELIIFYYYYYYYARIWLKFHSVSVLQEHFTTRRTLLKSSMIQRMSKAEHCQTRTRTNLIILFIIIVYYAEAAVLIQ